MANEMRLIDTAKFINDIHYYDEQQKNDRWTTAEIEYLLAEQPTVDAKPVVHGRWIEKIDMVSSYLSGCEELFSECSVCHAAEISGSNYCPNCGAQMDGGNEDG